MWLLANPSSAAPRWPGSVMCRDALVLRRRGHAAHAPQSAVAARARESATSPATIMTLTRYAGFVRVSIVPLCDGIHVPVFCHDSRFCSATAPFFFAFVGATTRSGKTTSRRVLCSKCAHAALRRRVGAKNSSAALSCVNATVQHSRSLTGDRQGSRGRSSRRARLRCPDRSQPRRT